MWWLSRATSVNGDWEVKILKDGIMVVGGRVQDLSPLMRNIATYLKSLSRVAFLNQSFGGHKWPARTTPSILGIVADLANGPDVHEARFKDRPALVDTGRLRSSFNAVTSARSVQIVSRAPYAKLMNDGGLASLPVTQAVKGNLKTLLKSDPSLRPALGFLFRRDEVHAEIPPRPFIGVTDNARGKINKMLLDYLEGQQQVT